MTKLSKEILQARLNASGRQQIQEAVLQDAFKKRIDVFLKNRETFIKQFIEFSWGESPQSRTANKKLAKLWIEKQNELTNRNFLSSGASDLLTKKQGRYLEINIQGQLRHLTLIDFDLTQPFNSTSYFSPFYESRISDKEMKALGAYKYFHVQSPKQRLNLTDQHPLAKMYLSLVEEADQIGEAYEEFALILNTVLKNSTKLEQAIKKFPDLSNYSDAILSKSREIILPPEELSELFNKLKNGKEPIKKLRKRSTERSSKSSK